MMTISPWLILISLLFTAAVMVPLTVLAVRHRRPAVAAPTTINITYNVLHLHEQAPGVGAATYRQLPGPARAIGWPGHQEGPRP
jgi:hypothetical protein